VSNTIDDLKAAFAGESKAFQKYTAYAKKAAADGFTNIAKHFEATAQSHKARVMFGYAVAAEKVHASLYKKPLEAVREGKDLEISDFYLCPNCGYIELGTRPERCPICNLKGEKFLHYQA